MTIAIDVSDDDVAVLIAEHRHRNQPGYRNYYGALTLDHIAAQVLRWGMSQLHRREAVREALRRYVAKRDEPTA
jgi:hypothetical protein